MLSIGTQIRHAMERKNISKMYVAQHTGITTYNLAKMMRDDIHPKAFEIEKLEKMLNVRLRPTQRGCS